MKRPALVLSLAFIPLLASPPTATARSRPGRGSFEVLLKIRHGKKTYAHAARLSLGTQMSHVGLIAPGTKASATRARRKSPGSRNFIFNALPTTAGDGSGRIALQLQLELGGRVRGERGPIQMQTEVLLAEGRELLVGKGSDWSVTLVPSRFSIGRKLPARARSSRRSGWTNYRLKVRLRRGKTTYRHEHVATDGSQSNFVGFAGRRKSKKRMIFNALIRKARGGPVGTQYQLELSPPRGKPGKPLQIMGEADLPEGKEIFAKKGRGWTLHLSIDRLGAAAPETSPGDAGSRRRPEPREEKPSGRTIKLLR